MGVPAYFTKFVCAIRDGTGKNRKVASMNMNAHKKTDFCLMIEPSIWVNDDTDLTKSNALAQE